MTRRSILFAALLGGAFTLMLAFADPAMAQRLTLDAGGQGTGTLAGRVVQLVGLMTVLSIAPAILIMMTSFTRIVVVLSMLRSAIGIQTTPPNVVMLSLALFLTGFIMAPVLNKSYEEGIRPLLDERIDETEAFDKAITPFKQFMLQHTRRQDIQLFADVAKAGPFATPADVPIQIIVPSFIISELRRAFEIGFLLFIPFLIIDMVVASILMSMGMMMLPPITVSLPFKIIFFVLVDGWYLIAGSLIRSYGGIAGG
ncbi:flagellar type III secretion system pore protein FliP [Roseiterribacter gracilis]|uniref:Flagellar biosynthetic protein FliP n=1 Tax=Roseiterribacter gracilis TaxID=2812848 RepID=A0A8S8XFZ4_9PROT|nr:flagellar biosynthetic protein FliP [Rhodospirillales bacterium TMPK1]